MQSRKGAAQWGPLVSQWEASGRSAEVFANEHGVTEAALRWWKRELSKRSATTRSVAVARVVRSGDAPAIRGERGSVTVIVGEARVVVEQGFDAQLLREVVRALEEAR
jgi:hypothetical protein